jgi:hypothetical protein
VRIDIEPRPIGHDANCDAMAKMDRCQAMLITIASQTLSSTDHYFVAPQSPYF